MPSRHSPSPALLLLFAGDVVVVAVEIAVDPVVQVGLVCTFVGWAFADPLAVSSGGHSHRACSRGLLPFAHLGRRVRAHVEIGNRVPA